MKTLMVSHLLELLWAEERTPRRNVFGVPGRAPGDPNPAQREVHCYKRLTFRLLRVPSGFPVLLAKDLRAGRGIRVASWISGSRSEGTAESGRRGEGGGYMAREIGYAPKHPSPTETRGREWGAFAHFLEGFQTCNDLRGKASRVQKGGVQGLETPTTVLRRGPPPKVRAHSCPCRGCALPPAAEFHAPPALCREIWEVAWAGSSYAPGASPAVRAGTVPLLPGQRTAAAWTRTTRRSTSPSRPTVLPVSATGALFPGRLSAALFCSLLPARSAMAWQCV